MSEIKAFFIRLVILLIFLWLLFGVFFGITPMRGNDMFPRISAGDLLLYYRLEKNFNSGDVLVFRKQGKISTGRVVAHGGDSVEITGDGELKVNGSIVIETKYFFCAITGRGEETAAILGRFLKKKSKEKSSLF